jgi:hypothetical protein
MERPTVDTLVMRNASIMKTKLRLLKRKSVALPENLDFIMMNVLNI